MTRRRASTAQRLAAVPATLLAIATLAACTTHTVIAAAVSTTAP